MATPSLRQMLLIVHIERPAPDAFLPLMSEWNAMFTYLSWMFSTVVLPGPAVPKSPLQVGEKRSALRTGQIEGTNARATHTS